MSRSGTVGAGASSSLRAPSGVSPLAPDALAGAADRLFELRTYRLTTWPAALTPRSVRPQRSQPQPSSPPSGSTRRALASAAKSTPKARLVDPDGGLEGCGWE